MGMVKYIYYDGVFTELPSYIYKNKKNGRFEIRKRVGGVLLYWGSFPTLEEAKMYRAYYMGKKWNVNPSFRANQYIRRQGDKYLIIKPIQGKQEYFGSFDTLAEAQRERDICNACNWDYDLIVEMEV